MPSSIKTFLDALETCVRPRTFPFGVKLLKNETDIPKGIFRASDILGHRVSLCQAFAYSRYRKFPLAMLKEDMVCPVGAMVLGMVEPPDYFLAGDVHWKRNTDSKEAAGKMARSMYRFEPGTYCGAVTVPLASCTFDIDVALVYVNAFQLGNLVLGSLYKEGGRFPAEVLPSAVCDAMVPAIKEGRCNFNIPCPGDRRYGRATDEEILFAVPANKLEELASGLMTCAQHNGLAVVNSQWLESEPTMPEIYDKVRKDLDML